MKNEENLQKFLDDNKISAEIVYIEKGSKTVKEAAISMGISAAVIAKSVVFVTKSQQGLICVIQGNKRVDFKKVEKIVGETINTASPEEVLRYTQYKAGGVPPVSTGLKSIIDEDVMKLEECYAGGGSDSHLLKINPDDIKKYSSAAVAEIKKS